MEVICENNENDFEFNCDNTGLTGEILINDFITKQQYKLCNIDLNHVGWWMTVLCNCKCYTYYRKNECIYLVVTVDEYLKYICAEDKSILPHITIIRISHSDREYFVQDGTKYTGQITEIKCEPVPMDDIMTRNIDRITNLFELRSIIHALRKVTSPLRSEDLRATM